MNWLQANWFRVVIILGLFIIVAFAGIFTLSNIHNKKEISELKNLQEKQNAELEEKNKTIDELNIKFNAKTETSNNQSASKAVDPSITIERCKTEAKKFADGDARRMYLQAFEKAQSQGETEAAQFYLEASFKPEHPANYDSNYQTTYINCLNK